MLIEYYNTLFIEDLKFIRTSVPNETIQRYSKDFFVHPEIIFFGINNRYNIEDDFIHIPEKRRNIFYTTLFITTTIDYFIKMNFEPYEYVKKLYFLPKFGWAGFGPHIVHPYALFSIVKDNNLLNENNLSNLRSEINNFIQHIVSGINGIDITELISAIKNDSNQAAEMFPNFKESFIHPIIFEESEKWKIISQKVF